MHQVEQTLSHEGIASISFAQRVAMEEVQAAQGVKMLTGFVVEDLGCWSPWKDFAPVLWRQEIGQGIHRCQHRRAKQERIGNDFVPDGNGVPRKETVAPIVACQTELTAARHRLEHARVRTKTKIATPQRMHRILRATLGLDRPITAPVGAINPPIEAPTQSVGPELLITCPEPGEEHLGDIGTPVPVGVPKKQQIGGRGDQNSVPIGHYRIWKRQPLSEHRGPFVATVSVPIFQASDCPSVAGIGIIPHLRHE